MAIFTSSVFNFNFIFNFIFFQFSLSEQLYFLSLFRRAILNFNLLFQKLCVWNSLSFALVNFIHSFISHIYALYTQNNSYSYMHAYRVALFLLSLLIHILQLQFLVSDLYAYTRSVVCFFSTYTSALSSLLFVFFFIFFFLHAKRNYAWSRAKQYMRT